jgi:hypothetical protein
VFSPRRWCQNPVCSVPPVPNLLGEPARVCGLATAFQERLASKPARSPTGSAHAGLSSARRGGRVKMIQESLQKTLMRIYDEWYASAGDLLGWPTPFMCSAEGQLHMCREAIHIYNANCPYLVGFLQWRKRPCTGHARGRLNYCSMNGCRTHNLLTRCFVQIANQRHHWPWVNITTLDR